MKKYITLFVLLISTIIYLLYTTNEKQPMLIGDKFYKALFSEKDLEPLLKEEESNWQYLVKLEYAAKNLALPEAMFTYNSLANNTKAPDVLRELAQYLEVMNLFHFDNGKINSEKINNLESSIIYPYSSKEAIAIIKIRNNDIQSAAEVLHKLLNDEKCPILIKANAQELLRIYEN